MADPSERPIDRQAPVLIIGGGIAGLSAALSFAKAGFTTEIHERATTLGEAGSGIQLSPNALRVLGRLGLMETLSRTAVAAESVTLRRWRSGGIIAEVPVLSGDGTPYMSLRRADLQAALLAAVHADPAISLHLGHECTGAARDGNRIAVDFRDLMLGRDVPSARRHAQIVIAADGVASSVAKALGHPAARAFGDIAWRLTMPETGQTTGGIEAWLGPARHAVAYPVDSGRARNLVLIEPGAGIDRGETIDAAELARRFSRWDPRLGRLIAASGQATAWPLMTASRAARPSDPPGLLLVGDAAHAMLPYAAQGAALAIEDGWTAAASFASSATPTEAVAAYTLARQARIERVRGRVAFHARVYHLPFPLSLARDAALALRPRASLARDLGWLYDWVPTDI